MAWKWPETAPWPHCGGLNPHGQNFFRNSHHFNQLDQYVKFTERVDIFQHCVIMPSSWRIL